MASKKNRKTRDLFRIPAAQWPDDRETLREIDRHLWTLRDLAVSKGSEKRAGVVPATVVKAMADIATDAWKARGKMLNPGSGEVREEMKRVYRHIEGILESLAEIGLEVKDHTGEAFDYGLPLKVVTTQPTEGITKESVIETIKPTVFWQTTMIQMGEVVIATPGAPTTQA